MTSYQNFKISDVNIWEMSRNHQSSPNQRFSSRLPHQAMAARPMGTCWVGVISPACLHHLSLSRCCISPSSKPMGRWIRPVAAELLRHVARLHVTLHPHFCARRSHLMHHCISVVRLGPTCHILYNIFFFILNAFLHQAVFFCLKESKV